MRTTRARGTIVFCVFSPAPNLFVYLFTVLIAKDAKDVADIRPTQSRKYVSVFELLIAWTKILYTDLKVLA